MRPCPSRIVLLATLSLVASAAADARSETITFAYTSTAPKACRTFDRLKIGDTDYANARVCPGHGGHVVVVTEDDLRETVSIGHTIKRAGGEPAARQGFRAFNSAHETVEWRSARRRPFAIIQRWSIGDNAETGKDNRPTSRQLLIVTRLPPGAVCHVAYVDVAANPTDANVLARRAADALARSFRCDADKVQVLGNGGRATALAMD